MGTKEQEVGAGELRALALGSFGVRALEVALGTTGEVGPSARAIIDSVTPKGAMPSQVPIKN